MGRWSANCGFWVVTQLCNQAFKLENSHGRGWHNSTGHIMTVHTCHNITGCVLKSPIALYSLTWIQHTWTLINQQRKEKSLQQICFVWAYPLHVWVLFLARNFFISMFAIRPSLSAFGNAKNVKLYVAAFINVSWWTVYLNREICLVGLLEIGTYLVRQQTWKVTWWDPWTRTMCRTSAIVSREGSHRGLTKPFCRFAASLSNFVSPGVPPSKSLTWTVS
jgi:hypothetical protein